MGSNNNITEGIYIPNIESCWLYGENKETGNYEAKEEFLSKLLNGKLDYSFELVKNTEQLAGIEIKKFEGKLYTLDIINVKYTRKYTRNDEEMTTKDLKDWTYIDGFKFNGRLMTNWKRSGGKAREGENLFILDSIAKKAIDWARMDLKFKGAVSIAGVRAYESLPLSSIIGCIEINPLHILCINDYKSEFYWDMSKTWLEDKELHTETVSVKESNSIWDGEGLLTDKIFSDNELIKGHGVALLRNRFMKCAGFCCYMEKYYRKYCGDNGLDYEIYEVADMYGNMIKVKDIELITTPSAIKLSKYNEEVLKVDGYEGDGAWLQYWKDNCGETFGVCKTDKPSHFKDGLNTLSYQMVNTIPFTKDELTNLVAPEIEYITKLKNDLNFFMQEVNQDIETDLDKDEDEAEDEDNDNDVEIGSNIDVTGAFVELVKNNPEFQKTQVFKDYRRNFISAYITKVRQGKIKIKSDYCVACGNPIELLKATVGEFDGTSELIDNELYCSRFDGAESNDVVGFRNPHINVGNIGQQVNHKVEDLVNYMECTSNIVFLNSIDYPILSTYQGEDFDIDSNLLTNDKIIVEACKRINTNATPIPFNDIKGEGNDAELTGKNMSDIDMIIAQNYIGSVINFSQELNSLMNHKKYNGLATETELNELYQKTSRLSSISQCEIDKAKKQFQTLNVPQELAKMKVGLKLVSETDKRRIKPYFFKFIGDNASKKQRKDANKKHRKELDLPVIEAFCVDNGIDIKELDIKNKKLINQLKVNDNKQKLWELDGYDKELDTPMNWVQLEMDTVKNSKGVGKLQVIDLVKKNKHKADAETIDYVVSTIKNLDIKIKAYKLNADLSSKDKMEKIRFIKKELSKDIRNMKLTKANLFGVMQLSLNRVKKNKNVGKKSGIESIALEILFKVYGTGLLEMFIK
ncbi:hypothetical protein K2F43_06000 [Clostridium estertheticum]|uniref:hypothetical protein n=1 Tax=Clostridium estertheticum TaxID=238834 RepID=UPI001C6E3F99|nr:hypothetical protein [Clostridium estertheticum]MBW9170758.1 hypothetical protein [Clostridium estertheticum]WLC74402.1 hypothetical protein KTC99_16750 [Clostridium estertheticum]